MQVAGRTIHAHLTLVESGVSKLQACLMLKTMTNEVWISGISSLFFKRLQWWWNTDGIPSDILALQDSSALNSAPNGKLISNCTQSKSDVTIQRQQQCAYIDKLCNFCKYSCSLLKSIEVNFSVGETTSGSWGALSTFNYELGLTQHDVSGFNTALPRTPDTALNLFWYQLSSWFYCELPTGLNSLSVTSKCLSPSFSFLTPYKYVCPDKFLT